MLEELNPIQAGLSTAVDLVVAEASLPPGSEADGPCQGGEDAGPLMNYVATSSEVAKGNKTVTRYSKSPRRAAEILAEVQGRTGGWPRVVDGVMFVPGPDHRPRYLDSPVVFFAWLDGHAAVDWQRGPTFVSQERFFEYARAEAEAYVSIEAVPHEPPLPGVYYMHPELPEADGTALVEFLSYFEPASDIDARLLLAAVATPCWGGEPGSRPAFLITGPPDDPQQGRGLGKSMLVDIFALLHGGSLDNLPSSEIEAVKTRMLSLAASSIRIARIDNVKTHKFSWADLEGLLTAGEISGRRLYAGEGRRRNLFTCFITLNGASLSKDMALRVIPIVLARPEYRGGWEDEVMAYVRASRWRILADIVRFLRGDAAELAARTRWAAWEQGVLARVPGPGECQAAIVERQGAMDDDEHDRDLVLEHFRAQLARNLHLGDRETVDMVRAFIPSRTAGQWLSELMNVPYPTNKATTFLKTLSLRELQHRPSRKTPGFVWRGAAWKGREGDAPRQLLPGGGPLSRPRS